MQPKTCYNNPTATQEDQTMKNAIFNGTYTEIFKHTGSAVLFTFWAATMIVCMLEYFDCLTR
jgi:hypothetical protein